MTARRFRKKPVVIEAVRFTGLNLAEVTEFMGETPPHEEAFPGVMVIKTLEGKLAADPGDWIIKGVAGEFYPCKADIFEKTYELVHDELVTAALNDGATRTPYVFADGERVHEVWDGQPT